MTRSPKPISALSRRKSACGFAMVLAVAVWVIAARADPFPLEPPDTSSPRATLQSFLINTSKGIEAYRRQAGVEQMLPWFQRAERTLDLSDVSSDRAERVAYESGLLLYEVINRVGIPEYDRIPGAEEVDSDELEKWVLPHSEIAIVRIDEGERAGEYLFSRDSVHRSLDFYERVQHLPNRTAYAAGNYEEFVMRPDFRLPHAWLAAVPDWAKASYFRNPLWKWFAVFFVLIAGLLALGAARRAGRALDRRQKNRGNHWRFGRVLFAVALILLPFLIDHLLEAYIGLRFDAQSVLSRVLLSLTFAAAVYAVFVLAGFATTAIISSKRIKATSIDAHFVRVVFRILAVAGSLVLIIKAVEFMGIPLTPVLAGLGIGGLAVALAARPTLENVIGGFTLFIDRPVRVGDFCRFGDQEGTIEEIGVRSTRIRKRDETVVSVPNSDFSNMQLQNNARRRRWLFRFTIGLRYETTPEQLRFALAELRAMLVGHPEIWPDFQFVRFVGFGDYALQIEIFAYIRTREWMRYLAVSEDLNLRIMDIVNKSGTGFAFPSQTNYFARDRNLDPERQRAAEEQVDAWRRAGELPFPDFSDPQLDRLKGSIDYPEKGSASLRKE